MGSVQFADEARRIAETFVEARRESRGLPDYPGDVPAALDDAYAVQDHAIAFDGRRIGGWKVGRINPPRDGVDRLAGPIFSDTIVDAREGLEMPIFGAGFGAAEAEFLLRLGATPPAGKTRFTEEEAADLIDAVHVGIEIASSPFPGINEHGPTVTISDYGNNNGLVIGPEIKDWRSAGINAWPVTLDINGARIGAATAETMLDGPVGAVRFLLELMAARGIVLEAGQWVSSGAVTGVHPVKPGDEVACRFGAGLEVECAIIAS
ncbi:2-keto-4-pentenoate hydratase [Sphingomonas naasensis]|uniref:2-keto-4-pentenoate hydratase n=1 Tax=Sphingomonas naasensis TaxID=1344951 RepID=A0A4V3QXH4_9SPHN|nr:fumarylacetoacetate hydrolase family protein [Sphingomonas naasensis]NIJ19209.1 2-keto-4-pentenoate hydratase [Sphingomonas naasensis]TGX46392.1 2-keto-4-pentenoate hydratase [Sphingomonas naasensis]